jgi:hypothetical protein
MKIIFRLLLMVTAMGLGLTLGFALRAKRVAEAGGEAVTWSPTATTTQPSPASSRRTSVRRYDDSPLATQLESDLSMSSGVTRWLYRLEALEKATTADFPRLLRLAQGHPAALRLIEARWVEVAPRQLFDTLVAGAAHERDLPVNELAAALFEDWPKRDPDAAIAALSETNNSGVLHYWRFDVAYTLIEKDIERALRLMSEWHADDVGFGTRGIAAVAKWTRADPRHAAEFMLEQPDSYSFRSAMEIMGQEWSKIDPAAALTFATAKPGELSALLATSALKTWAERNLSEAADWLVNADDRTRAHLSPAFVQVWAKQDAASALTWCEENLTGSGLAQAVGGVVAGASEKNVSAAAALVVGMDPSPARTQAAAAVAHKWFPELSSGQVVTPEAVAWLARLDPDSVNRVLNRISWTWGTSDPRSMAAFLASSSSDQIPPHAYTVAARELARRNPTDALAWASQLPEAQAMNAGGIAFAEWRGSQPELAMKWWNNLALDDARRQPFFESAFGSVAYHPQAAEQIAAMNPTERAAARSVIEKMPLLEDRRAHLLQLLKGLEP